MPETWTVGRLITWTADYFAGKNIDTPRLDAELLLAYTLGRRRIDLYINFDQPLQAEELAAYRECVRRRAAHEPVAYILGTKEFMGLDFAVTSAVLIPRPETELLVETALAKLPQASSDVPLKIADIGTGSGAIIVSLAAALREKGQNCRAVAVDISPDALAIAQKNIAAHGLAAIVECRLGDLFDPLRDAAGTKYDLIISNPPYIPAGVIPALAPEVKNAEPNIALDGGADGLNFYRRLVAEATDYLADDGVLVMEIGHDQAAAVAALAVQTDRWKPAEIFSDLAGQDRVAALRKRNCP